MGARLPWRARSRLQFRDRRAGRAVECTGLENRQGFTAFVGSNPTPSARASINTDLSVRFLFLPTNKARRKPAVSHLGELPNDAGRLLLPDVLCHFNERERKLVVVAIFDKHYAIQI